jgi:hypothetical protein
MKGGAQVYSQLAWQLELVKEADGAPTQGTRQVVAQQSALLRKYEAEWAALVKDGLGPLNKRAQKLELPVIVVPTIRPPATDAPPTETRRARRFSR